jgi:hypothetical protein
VYVGEIRWGWGVWSGFTCLRIGTGDLLLWTRLVTKDTKRLTWTPAAWYQVMKLLTALCRS